MSKELPYFKFEPAEWLAGRSKIKHVGRAAIIIFLALENKFTGKCIIKVIVIVL